MTPVIALEARQLLSAATPLGGEFQVNTYTNLSQSDTAVAMDADGDFVVTWTGAGQFEGSYYSNVYSQRYNAAGVAQGPESRVNTTGQAGQSHSAVAMNAAGNYVVTWSSRDIFGPSQDGSDSGVFAQRYNAAGVAQGGEFQVNTFTTGSQDYSAVAIDSSGNFVVTWYGAGTDGDSNGVYARRFNAAGSALGSQFQVNTTTAGGQGSPDIAMDASGDFVITWDGTDGSDLGIFAQRYNAAGVAQGSEFRVNTNTLGRQILPYVAMDADGDFVIGWNSELAATNWVQRYNAAGVAQGTEFVIESSGLGAERGDVAMDSSGDFVITWSRANQEGNNQRGIYGKVFNAAGVAQGTEFHVNTYTTGNQHFSAVAVDTDGDFVVTWQSQYQDGNDYGVYARRYALQEPPTDITLSANSVAENQPSGTTIGNLSSTDPDVGGSFTYSLVSGTGSTDNTSFTIVGNQLRTAASFNFEAKTSYSIRVRSTDSSSLSFEKVFTVNVTNVNESPTVANQSFGVKTRSAAGTVVGTVVANDPDVGQTRTFSIISGNLNNAFVINATTGQITVLTASAVKRAGTFSLVVRVTDNGSPALFQDATMTITVSRKGTAAVTALEIKAENAGLDALMTAPRRAQYVWVLKRKGVP